MYARWKISRTLLTHLKQWHCDSLISPPNLLKFRSGHQAPPHLIRYYGEDGKQLLTASRDRSLRCTSVVRDSRSFELSQGWPPFHWKPPLTTNTALGSLTKKATTLSVPLTSLKHFSVTALSYSTTRSKDWDDILTAHSDEAYARTWSMLNKRLGKHTLGILEKGKTRTLGVIKASPCLLCFLSPCSNE